MTASNISVSVRLRPTNSLVQDAVVSVNGSNVRLSKMSLKDSNFNSSSSERNEEFTFDRCYSKANNTQENIFRDIGEQAVYAVDDGFNCCVFAYGQTASGKTYTMFGTEKAQGLTPRILNALISKIGSESQCQCSIKMGYLEIYNEKVHDLLGWRPSSCNVSYQLPSLKVREHPVEGVFVQGLTMHNLSCYDEVKDYLLQGNKVRAIASTNINEHSSRSHAIIILKVVKRQPNQNGSGFSEVVSKLHLIDLAGSERVKHTGATSKRLKEGISINQSLTNLGKTISLLVEYSKLDPQKRQAFHIPYRNSNLTFLLKDSLGGNSKTFMIATISTAASNYSETRNTLLYASRARKIVNKPLINQDTNSQVVGDLKKEVECLKRLLAQASLHNQKMTGVSIGTATSTSSSPECCSHSQVMHDQLMRDERTIGDLLTTHESLSERPFSPESINGDINTREFGPPFLCRTSNSNSFTEGNEMSGMFFLKEGETKIGSDASKVDLLIEDDDVNDVHCSLFVEDDSATIIRHDSAFVAVNDEPVLSHKFVNHGNEISLSGRTPLAFTFYFPSQLATKMLRQHHRSSSRASLMSPPRSVSSCSSGASSRPLSNLYVDCSSNFSLSSIGQSNGSPEHSRCCLSMPARSFETESRGSMAPPSPQPSLPMLEDFSQQTEFACCSASENLVSLQQMLLDSCDKGVKQIVGENESIRSQIECQLDLIRCDNRKMALLEQKLYAEVEEELCSLNKTRKKLTLERIEIEDLVDRETNELESLSRLTRSRNASTRSVSDEESLFSLDYTESTLDLPSEESCEGYAQAKQASSNRYHILMEVQQTMEGFVRESSRNLQKKVALQKSILAGQNKLAEVERKLSSISDKCNWLCSYCDKLKEYFEVERSSMRDFETKMGNFCSHAKRQLDSKEDAIMQTKVKLERFRKTSSCPVSPARTEMSAKSPYKKWSFTPNIRITDEVFPRKPSHWLRNDIEMSKQYRSARLGPKGDEMFLSPPGSRASRDDSGILLTSRDDRSDSSFSAASMPIHSMMPSALKTMRGAKSTFVSVSVPRFRRRKSHYNYFHEYQIDVTLRDEAWTVFHRFSALRDVHMALKSKYAELRFLDFPPRKAFGSRLEKVAAERRLQLQQYLQCLVNLCICRVDQTEEAADSSEKEKSHQSSGISKDCLIQLLPFLDPAFIGSQQGPSGSANLRASEFSVDL